MKISLSINHDGMFQKCPLYYEGKITYLDDLDVSKLDIRRLRQYVEDVSSSEPRKMYFKLPNKDLENGLKPLNNDVDVKRFLSYGESSTRLEVFVNHFEVDIDELLNTDDQMEVEEHGCSSDDDRRATLDLSENCVNYRFSDVDDDEVASVDHLSEGDDEVRQVRMRKLSRQLEGEDVVQPQVNVEEQDVKVNEDVTMEGKEIVHSQAYQHDDFLTESCDEYERGALVEVKVHYENEIEIVNDDDEAKTNEFPIHNPNIPWNLMKPRLGERYSSSMELKACLTNYALANGLQLRYLKSSKKKLHVVCGPQKKGLESSCPWRLWASWMGNEESFQVKSLHDEHTCGRDYRQGSLINSNWIAMQYGHEIRQNPSIKLVDLKDAIFNKYKCNVHISQCSRAKAKALGEMETTLNEHYGKLWDYAEEIRRSNPGSTVKMSMEVGSDNNNYFQRFYVCFKGVKEGWLSWCRRFIGLDGCSLKNICNGELLSAVGIDGNNQFYPIAWAVVEVESKDSWKWFLDHLMQDIGLIDGVGVTLISDQDKGLVEAVKDVFPLAEHRQCARHIYKSFKKKYNGIQLRSLFWAASKAWTPKMFAGVMQEIKDLSHQAYDYLMERKPSTWSRAFFKNDASCDAVENGVSECFNSSIIASRRKPIITMLEEIRMFVIDRADKMSNKAFKWTHEVCPAIHKKVELNKDLMRFWRVVPDGGNMFVVKQGSDEYMVDTEARKCTCRIWQVSGVPCPHAVSAIDFMEQDPSKFVSALFSKTSFIKTYSHTIKPLNGQKLWPMTEFVKPLPPMDRRTPDRLAISRKRDTSEIGSQNRINAYGYQVVTKMGRKMTCKNCWEVGHNSRSCKNDKKDAPIQTKNPVGRPKGSTSQEGSSVHGSQTRVVSSQVKVEEGVTSIVEVGIPTVEATPITIVKVGQNPPFGDVPIQSDEDNVEVEATLASEEDSSCATPAKRTKKSGKTVTKRRKGSRNKPLAIKFDKDGLGSGPNVPFNID